MVSSKHAETDPGAAGLQTTSDGRPKVIDLVECTGSGDVDMSTVRKAEAGATSIEGLCGRTLKLNADWSNPTGQWRVGRKAAFEVGHAFISSCLCSLLTHPGLVVSLRPPAL